MDSTGRAARRFPLVPRVRPAAGPLPDRVAHLCTLAKQARRDKDQIKASTVHNQAALLASDIGLTDLARRWCHRHAAAYLEFHPLNAETARLALEPLVNLARLRIRAGHADAAYHLLTGLYEAVVLRENTTIDGLPLPAATLTPPGEELQKLRKWLWTVLLADGTRALTAAGRWEEARDHLKQHSGIGRRMLDGRQVAVIAQATAGNTHAALSLLADTITGEPWEDAVVACLTLLCQPPFTPARSADIETLLDRCRRLEAAPQPTVFRTRLWLSVADAISEGGSTTAGEVVQGLAKDAVAARDGYAARDVLEFDTQTTSLSEADRHQLAEVLEASGLDRGHLPDPMADDLIQALVTSTDVLQRAMLAR